MRVARHYRVGLFSCRMLSIYMKVSPVWSEGDG
jgi:hypothetical protein